MMSPERDSGFYRTTNFPREIQRKQNYLKLETPKHKNIFAKIHIIKKSLFKILANEWLLQITSYKNI